ncbi:MAG: hypothetical protein WBX25_36295 [Rhodomicrobium sp.]
MNSFIADDYQDLTESLPAILEQTPLCGCGCGRYEGFDEIQWEYVPETKIPVTFGRWNGKAAAWRFEDPQVLITGKTSICAAVGVVASFEKRGLLRGGGNGGNENVVANGAQAGAGR